MARIAATTLLVIAAYAAGTLSPRAHAFDSLQPIANQLQAIHQELSQIRRVMESKR